MQPANSLLKRKLSKSGQRVELEEPTTACQKVTTKKQTQGWCFICRMVPSHVRFTPWILIWLSSWLEVPPLTWSTLICPAAAILVAFSTGKTFSCTHISVIAVGLELCKSVAMPIFHCFRLWYGLFLFWKRKLVGTGGLGPLSWNNRGFQVHCKKTHTLSLTLKQSTLN